MRSNRLAHRKRVGPQRLTPSLEPEKSCPPGLSDLCESGCIGQDGDLAGMLYNPSLDAEDSGGAPMARPRQVALLTAKQRNGESGVDVPPVFFAQYTRFESAAEIDPEEVRLPHDD